ncbi:MAG: hypothetical protein Q8Q25_00745, partial [bacterium]|nr:hypothetical protein [bacterium]
WVEGINRLFSDAYANRGGNGIHGGVFINIEPVRCQDQETEIVPSNEIVEIAGQSAESATITCACEQAAQADDASVVEEKE